MGSQPDSENNHLLVLEGQVFAQCASFEQQVCIMHEFSDCHYDLRKFGRWPK